MKLKTLWVLAPCYKDVQSFLKLRQNLLRELQNTDLKLLPQFIVIDDTAGSDPEITQLKFDDTHIVTPPFNLGHQRAIVYALRSLLDQMAFEDYIVTLDSDGEDRPEDLTKLLFELEQDPFSAHIVLARRTKRKVSLKFRFLYGCFVIMFRILTGQIIKSGNYAVYRGFTAKKIINHPFFDLCYSSALVNVKTRLTYVPCERGTRYFDESKMGYFNLLVHGFRMLMPFIDKIAVRALIVSGFTTVGALGIGAAYVVNKLYFAANIPTLSIVLIFLFTFMSFFMASIFFLMFTIFSQSQSIVLSKLELQKWNNLNTTSNTKKVI